MGTCAQVARITDKRRAPPAKESVQQKDYILVIETDDLVRGLLEQWLGEAGYAVSARSLCDLLADGMCTDVPRLLIVDVPCPRSAGAIIVAVKQVYPSPVLVLSGRFRRGLGTSMDAAKRLGVSKVLAKPFTREELLTAVSEAVQIY